MCRTAQNNASREACVPVAPERMLEPDFRELRCHRQSILVPGKINILAMVRPILRPSRNVWRIEPAGRAAVLVDGAALYRALRESFIKARHSILIVGWDIDSRTRLVGESGDADDGFPVQLGEFLSALVQRRPGLTVRLLLWDYSVLYALERELLPQYALNWSTPDQVQLCLDNEAPLGCSQHQKVVVVDDAVAYSGGLDLTIRRWDTSAHALDNPHRVDPAGVPYPPYHDVQALVDGGAARALAELARTRWCRAKKAEVDAARRIRDPGPTASRRISPMCRSAFPAPSRASDQPHYPRSRKTVSRFHRCRRTDASISKTSSSPRKRSRGGSRAACAEENARSAHRRAQHSRIPGSRQHTMRNGRIRFRQILEKADVGDRWRMVYPHVESAGKIRQHHGPFQGHDRRRPFPARSDRPISIIVRWAPIPSATLSIEARNATEREAILRIRNQLLGEHCGSSRARCRNDA